VGRLGSDSRAARSGVAEHQAAGHGRPERGDPVEDRGAALVEIA
jgi:hypothetical protein